MRGSANPGGIGHEWVKAKFIDYASSSVAFVPSKLEDNPSLNQEEYEQSLAAISDEVLRAQLRHGDWDVRPAGRLFKREWLKLEDAYPSGLRWKRYWDLAGTELDTRKRGHDPDWTAGALVAVRELKGGAKELWIRDVRRLRGSPGDVERFIHATAMEDGKAVPIYIEEEPGSSGKNTTHNYASRVLFGFSVRGHRKTGSKVEMWGPVSAQAQAGNVYLVRAPWNAWWLEEAVAAPNPGVHDDGLDAVSGGAAVASQPEIVVR
jgi:predicted phage terminase large subunit-like protein